MIEPRPWKSLQVSTGRQWQGRQRPSRASVAPVNPVLIDAAAALRILMSPNDKTADPHEQTSFIERMSRSGHFHLRAFPGYATKSEPTPPEDVCTLTFDWNARASEVHDQLGQLDLWGSDG